MPGKAAIRVEGLRELQAALAKADRQTRLGVRGELRQVAEPVRRGAEELARSRIPRITQRWSKMRTGIVRDLIYVAPRQRGIKARDDPRKRPKFGPLLLERAMEPALERREGEVEVAFEAMLDRVADNFNHGGGEL